MSLKNNENNTFTITVFYIWDRAEWNFLVKSNELLLPCHANCG